VLAEEEEEVPQPRPFISEIPADVPAVPPAAGRAASQGGAVALASQGAAVALAEDSDPEEAAADWEEAQRLAREELDGLSAADVRMAYRPKAGLGEDGQEVVSDASDVADEFTDSEIAVAEDAATTVQREGRQAD